MKKLKDINWNQVYYFYEVARKMSMKEAAEVTGVSIPTVSEQIKRLETLLETPLFHRRPRRIELTVEGETLFHHAKQMFESGLRFLDVVAPTVIGGYPVRVGVQESFSAGFAFDFLLRYFDAFSPFGTVNTRRELHADRILEDLHGGHIDWGILQHAPSSPRLEHGKIGSCEVVFAASDEALARFANPIEALHELPLARCRHDEQLNKLVSDHLQSADIFVEETIESDHWEFCMRLAEAGKCVTALASPNAASIAAHGGLKTFAVGGPIVLSYYAVWRQSSGRMIAIRKLVELLEKDTHGFRGRGGPLGSLAHSNESAPVELPHRFEQAPLATGHRH